MWKLHATKKLSFLPPYMHSNSRKLCQLPKINSIFTFLPQQQKRLKRLKGVKLTPLLCPPYTQHKNFLYIGGKNLYRTSDSFVFCSSSLASRAEKQINYTLQHKINFNITEQKIKILK